MQKGKRFAEIEHSAHDGGNRSQSCKDGSSRCADDGDGVIGTEKGYNAAADSQILDTDQKNCFVIRQRDILLQCSLYAVLDQSTAGKHHRSADDHPIGLFRAVKVFDLLGSDGIRALTAHGHKQEQITDGAA